MILQFFDINIFNKYWSLCCVSQLYKLVSDINECRIMPFLCRNGRCRNTIGGFVCECADGYVLAQDSQHCRDIDECHEVRPVDSDKKHFSKTFKK